MKPLNELYKLWDALGNVPVSAGTKAVAPDTIEEAFLHFPIGTPRETIWRWFEAQNPEFMVGEVMQGHRR